MFVRFFEILVFLVERAKCVRACFIRANLDRALRCLSGNPGATTLHSSFSLSLSPKLTILIIISLEHTAMKYNGQTTDDGPRRDESLGSNGIKDQLISNSPPGPADKLLAHRNKVEFLRCQK